MEPKRAAGEKAAEYVRDGMTVGLGTGSTAYWAIRKLGERVKDGLNIKATATSLQSEQLAGEWGIPLTPLGQIEQIDLTIDGADEVDEAWNLIKGGGGALLREKMVAALSKQLLIVVDPTKCVSNLGAFPLPVEVVQFGWEATSRHLAKLGCSPMLRSKDGAPYITDNGNFILDCRFEAIPEPSDLDERLHRIPGVVETGLFIRMASTVIVGGRNGAEIRTRPAGRRDMENDKS